MFHFLKLTYISYQFSEVTITTYWVLFSMQSIGILPWLLSTTQGVLGGFPWTKLSQTCPKPISSFGASFLLYRRPLTAVCNLSLRVGWKSQSSSSYYIICSSITISLSSQTLLEVLPIFYGHLYIHWLSFALLILELTNFNASRHLYMLEIYPGLLCRNFLIPMGHVLASFTQGISLNPT